MKRSGSRKRKWFTEWLTPHETHGHELKRIVVEKKTGFQNAVIADTYSFGRCLILDGEMQSAQSDEYIYHEALVHPALTTHPRPRTVAILGGGEGATLREILRHRTVRRAVMVDIDGEVVRFCEKHLKPWHRGTFSDPRAEVIIGDAKKFVEETKEKFDIVLSDLPTPTYGGPVQGLYAVEFYRALRRKLAEDGVLAVQAGSGSLLQIGFHLKLYRTLKEVFPVVRPYSVFVPSFDVPWSFILCSPSKAMDPLELLFPEVEKRLARRADGGLRFYDGMTHEGLFRIPKDLRTLLAREKGVISLKRPVRFA